MVNYNSKYISDETKAVLSRWSPSWYHRYDGADIKTILDKDCSEFWFKIETIRRFSDDHPDSNVPTLEMEGVTENDLSSFIQTRCHLKAGAKMREVDLSLDNIEKALNGVIGRHYSVVENKFPTLGYVIIALDLIFMIILAIFAGGALFERGVLLGIVALLAIMISSFWGFYLLFVILGEASTIVINRCRPSLFERAINTLDHYDSVNSRVNEIRRKQRTIEDEENKKRIKTSFEVVQHIDQTRIKDEIENLDYLIEDHTIMWPLLDFARIKGKMQVGVFRDGDRTYKTCIFTDNMGDKTFVAFSKEIGELTPSEIAAQKQDLVVMLKENSEYVLTHKNMV